MVRKSLLHLKKSNVTYWQHFRHAWGMNAYLILIFYYSTVHSIVPGFYEDTAYQTFQKMLAKQKRFKEYSEKGDANGT